MEDSKKSTLVSIFEKAVQLEQEGEAYYREASQKTTDKFSKVMLGRLAEDEVEHAKILRQKLDEVKGVGGEGENCNELIEQLSKKGLKIFPQDPETIRPEITSSEENLAIIKVAIEKEKAAISLYSDAKKQVDDENVKPFLEFLVNMEKQHECLLSDYLNFLLEPVSGWDNMERWACQS